MKKVLSIIISAVLVFSLAMALTSCDVLEGVLGGVLGTEPEAPSLDGITLPEKTVTYNGEAHSLEIKGTLPEGVTVKYENNGKTDAGKYTVVAKFYNGEEYMEGKDLTADLRINKASLSSAMEGVSFSGAKFTYDGEAHSLAISGTLPEGVTVSYVGN